MNLQFRPFAALAIFCVLAFSAQAHDPSLHEPAPAAAATAKAKPTTCAQLADAKRYDVESSDAAVKALKARCAAPKKAATPAAKGG
jgi:hypothetical protein